MSYRVQRSAAFDAWLADLTDPVALDAVVDRIERIATGLLGDRRSVGTKVGELRIDVGPGYRLYCTMGGRILVLLLCGGTKRTQKADIRKAEAMAKAAAKRGGSGTGRVKERREGYASETDEPLLTDQDLVFAPWDAADYLQRDSSQIYLLRQAFASGHPVYIANAVDAVTRARARTRGPGPGGSERETGVKRQTLNKSLSAKATPTLETLVTVLAALGLRLEIVEAQEAD